MSTGRSLHVGLNRVSPDFPNAPVLTGPENDAEAMRDLAAQTGFQTDILKSENATHTAVLARLLDAAYVSKPGDIFLFTFAGHGCALPDRAPNRDEDDNQDEAIVLYDMMMLDDELRLTVWPAFQAGVRILMVADSCHSGTVLALFNTGARTDAKTVRKHVREISDETRNGNLRRLRFAYQQVLVPIVSRPINASVLLLAACADKETTPDGPHNGVFTAALLYVLQNLQPQDYCDLINKTDQRIGGPQHPVLTAIAPADENFIHQRPFTI